MPIDFRYKPLIVLVTWFQEQIQHTAAGEAAIATGSDDEAGFVTGFIVNSDGSFGGCDVVLSKPPHAASMCVLIQGSTE